MTAWKDLPDNDVRKIRRVEQYKFCARNDCALKFYRRPETSDILWESRLYCGANCRRRANKLKEALGLAKPRAGPKILELRRVERPRPCGHYDADRAMWIYHAPNVADAFDSCAQLLDKHSPGWRERRSA